MQPFSRATARRRMITMSTATALPLSLSLLIAAPLTGQQGAGNQDTTRPASADSAQAAAQAAAKAAACTQLKAYAKRTMADSIKAMWKSGAMFPTTDTMATQMQVQVPQISLDAAKLPDSMRTVVATAGPSCKAAPTPQVMMQLVQEQMGAPRPVIGVKFQPLTPKDTAGLGLPNTRGLLVQAVTPGFGAAAAGIAKGDVIVGLNGQSIGTMNQFLQKAAKWTDGEVIKVEVVHQGGKREKLDVTAKMSK